MERYGMQRDGARCSERCSGASARNFSLLERLPLEMQCLLLWLLLLPAGLLRDGLLLLPA